MTKEMEEFTILDEYARIDLAGKGTLRDIRPRYHRLLSFQYRAWYRVRRAWQWCFRRRLAIRPYDVCPADTARRLFEWQRMPRGFRWW